MYEDVSALMVKGENRVINPGKLSVAVEWQAARPTATVDACLVILGPSRTAIGLSSAVSASTRPRRDRSVRHVLDFAMGDPEWRTSLFEVSTELLPPDTTGVALLVAVNANGKPEPIGSVSRIRVSVEDGLTVPHVFRVCSDGSETTLVLANIYRSGDLWKLRAVDQGFVTDRMVVEAQFGIAGFWTAGRPTSAAPAQGLVSPPRPSRPSVPSTGAGSGSLSPASASSPPPIDPKRLAELERETNSVSALLSGIFGDEKPKAAPPKPVPPPAVIPIGIDGLDDHSAGLLATLMTASSMSVDDYGEQARIRSLMPAGATETINEWAFEKCGGPVIVEENGRIAFDETHRAAVNDLMA